MSKPSKAKPAVEPKDDLQAFYAGLIAKHSSDSIVVTGLDGRVEWCNRAFEIMSGYQLDEVVGTKPGDLLQGRDTASDTVDAIRTALADRVPIRTEILNYTKTGVPYWIELNITPIFDAQGVHTHFMSIERDVTERKRLEAQTKAALESEQRRREERKLLSLTSEWLYAAQTLEELLSIISGAMIQLFPQAQGALYIYSNSRDVLDLAVHWGGGDPVAYLEPDECWALRRGRSYFYGANAIEFPCTHTKNEDTPNFCLPIVAHGDTIGLMNFAFAEHSRGAQSPEALEQILQPAWELGLICAEQISLAIANVRLRMELQDQSVRDQLTGLWNRRWFVDMLAKEIARSASRSLPLSLISIDVDHFKRFNDHHGHDAGDAVLRHVGEVLASQAQDGLAACRVGGEEFAIICPGFDQDRARALGDDLRDRVSEIVVRHGGQQLPRITMSAGVASLSEALRDPSALIKGADQALYAAKAAGRDQVKRFTDLDQSPDLAASA